MLISSSLIIMNYVNFMYLT